MNKNVERLYNGLIKENPTFVSDAWYVSDTCCHHPQQSTDLAWDFPQQWYLYLSNMLISAFRKVIPDGVRMPAYIVIVASLVTVVQFIMQAYTTEPASESLGVYIPSNRCKLYYPRPC